MKTEQTFEEHLRKGNLSENTITSYLWTVNYFHEHYDKISKDNLLAYKGYLMEFFKPNEYYGAAEPPVRCGESHLSGLTEPLRSL